MANILKFMSVNQPYKSLMCLLLYSVFDSSLWGHILLIFHMLNNFPYYIILSNIFIKP
jgi:hypothetical protein